LREYYFKQLIEEMMITANAQVAQKLVETFPSLTPLRRQRTLTCEELQEWQARHRQSIQRYPMIFGRYLTNSEDDPSDQNDGDQRVDINAGFYSELRDAVRLGDINRVRLLVFSIKCNPQMALASAALQHKYQKTAEYVRHEASEPPASWRHEHLKLPLYLRFTSPLRRYMDLVVHRFVNSFLCGDGVSDYGKKEIDDICRESNELMRRVKDFREESRDVHIGYQLKGRPIALTAVVYEPNKESLKFLFPSFSSFLLLNLEVKMAVLQPDGMPQLADDNSGIEIKWQQRIYNTRVGVLPSRIASDLIPLRQDKYVVSVDASKWTELIKAVSNNDKEACFDAFKTLEPSFFDPKNAENLTSEGRVAERLDHFCKYSMCLKSGSVVKLQLCGDLQGKLPKPCIQLMHLTDTEIICIQHATDAVKCFIKPIRGPATDALPAFRDLQHYRQFWLPILAMEAAFSAVINEYSAVIHNVLIKWQSNRQTGEAISGSFTLESEFCKNRGIRFLLTGDTHHTYTNNGYMCVRYSCVNRNVNRLAFDDDDDEGDDDDDLFGSDSCSCTADEAAKPFTWVGHCLVSQVNQEDTRYRVTLSLNQNSSEFPRSLLTDLGERQPVATVEWMEKTLPDKYYCVLFRLFQD
jgi:hypothetical protein